MVDDTDHESWRTANSCFGRVSHVFANPRSVLSAIQTRGECRQIYTECLCMSGHATCVECILILIQAIVHFPVSALFACAMHGLKS